ncbi:hypothetical protein [Methylotuvimicrobium alcaliphilum]|nr:hypothetical protein [Methylotuvimicrobium alcaliphilum]
MQSAYNNAIHSDAQMLRGAPHLRAGDGELLAGEFSSMEND